MPASSRDGKILAAGIAAAVLVNYWVAGPILGVDHDPGFSWISDFAARGEDGNRRFALLDGLSGAAVILFGALLWPRMAGEEGEGPGASALRWGLILLIASGALAIADAFLPMSCGRSLGTDCVRADDLVDELHRVESTIAVLVTGGAMLLIGAGLWRSGRGRAIAWISLAAGVVFLALNLLIGLRESVDAFNDAKGWFQRGGQVVLGAWLVAMAVSRTKME